uniref:ATP synthase complex subunit 8 n=1 Tax=Xyronotus aztecus TaxID=62797 RepID=A0A7G8LRP6_9ORTH|nr:ATP synthase F0 subunit 8 [Xyronotus aztecus]
MKSYIPQMSPLMWLSLLILFSMTVFLFNQMNFFSFKPQKIEIKSMKMIKEKFMNWKW